MNENRQIGTILFEVALLTVVVLIVEEPPIRAALAFVPALLLAQRAVNAASGGVPVGTPWSERREDDDVRDHIKRLLAHFREFYATCHRLGKGEIASDEAMRQTGHLETELNRLLDEVTNGTREGAGIPATAAETAAGGPEELAT